MISSSFYNELRDHAICELRRAPLDPMILQLKMFDMGAPKELLALAIEPPSMGDIVLSIRSLKHMGALSLFSRSRDGKGFRLCLDDGDLTYLGKVLALLPLDVRLGKLVMFGWTFGVLEESVIIAACLNDRGFFTDPFEKRLEGFEKRLEWAKGTCSDLLALLHVYQNYQESFDVEYDDCNAEKRREIREWCNENFVELKKLKVIKHLVAKVLDILKNEEIHVQSTFQNENMDNETRLKFIKLAICGAFFPLYFSSQPLDAQRVECDSLNWEPKRTIRFNNFPVGAKIEELACVKNQLETMFQAPLKHSPKIELHIRDSKLYAVFDESAVSNQLVKGSINKAIYVALKMRRCGRWRRPRIDFNKLDCNAINRLTCEDLYTAPSVQFEGVETCEKELLEDSTRGLVLRGSAPNRTTVDIGIHIQSFECTPQHIKNPYTLMVQRSDSDSREKLTKIKEMIKDIQLTGKDTVSLPKRMLQKGTVCLATDPHEEECGEEDVSQTMYRCEINEVKGKKCKVSFVDYGNTAEVSNRSLKDILPEYEELRSIEFQAFPIRLSHVRSSSVKSEEMANQKEAVWEMINEYYEMNYRFEVLVFSVTDGATVHGDLYAYPISHTRIRQSDKFKHNPKAFLSSIKEKGLIDIKQLGLEKGFYAQADESTASKRNNMERQLHQKRQEVIQVTGYDPLLVTGEQMQVNSVRRLGEVELSGPFSPLELTFCGFTQQLHPRRSNVKIRIAPDSINSVALDENADLCEEKLLVAGSVQISERDKCAILRNTTLIDKQKGYLELVSLMFTPDAKIKVDRSRNFHISAFCGSGTVEVEEGQFEAVNSAMDAEIPIGVVLNNDDFFKLNQMRYNMNCLLGPVAPKLRPRSNEQQICHINNIRKLASKLLLRKRQFQTQESESFNEFSWHSGRSKQYYEPIEPQAASNPPYDFSSIETLPYNIFHKLLPQRRACDDNFPVQLKR